MIPKIITYETLKTKFQDIFTQPKPTEVYFQKIENGWIIDFGKNGYCIVCKIMIKDLIDELKVDLKFANKELTKELFDDAVKKFENHFLRYAIPSENVQDFFNNEIREEIKECQTTVELNEPLER